MLEDDLGPIGDMPHQQMSYLEWVLQSAGPMTWLLLFLLVLFAIGTIVLLWLRGRGPAQAPAILLVMALPLVAGALVFLNVSVNGFLKVAEDPRAVDTIQSQGSAFLIAYGSTCCFVPVLFVGVIVLLVLGLRGPKS
jgi:hypothetical protein